VTAVDGPGPNGPATPPTATARNSAVVAIWTLLSRVTGLLRVVVIGAVLGATYFANCFQATNVVPNIVFSLIAGPVLTMVVVPGLIGALDSAGQQRAREVFARIMGWLLLIAIGGVLLLVVASPLIAWTLTRGIADPVERGRALYLTRLLLMLVAPQLPIYCLVHLGVSAQRARGRFALSAAAPAVENVILIMTVVLTGWHYGTGIGLAQVPMGMVVALGAGSTAAVAVHAALQLFGTARVGLLSWPSLRRRGDEEALAVIRRLSRSVGVAALPSLAMYVLLAIAGSVPGGVFVVQMSYSVLYALSYLSARAVSMASLPELSEAVRNSDPGAFAVVWRRGLAYALVASLPLLVLLVILGGPTATILANGELRHTALIGPLGVCLALVAVAQLVTGLSDLGNQALYARLEDRVPRIASRVTLAVTVLVAAAALLVPAGGNRLVWLVVAILAGELASTAMVLGRLRRVIRPEPFMDRRMLTGTLLAALAMVPISGVAWWVQHTYADGQLETLAVLAVGGGLAVATYGLVLRSKWRSRPLAAS
jgi:putative peptidoglycan lipid II flippase